MIYLDDFDLILYTTVCPHTSIIFVAKSNKQDTHNQENSKNNNSNR